MPRQFSVLSLAVPLVLALGLTLPLAGCAAFGRAGATDSLRGTVTLDRQARPAAVLVTDSERGTWRLEGPLTDDLRELDRALVEVRGAGDLASPRGDREPGRFVVRSYRLVEVGGRPALAGMLAWEGSALMLVELERDDQRVALAGPVLPQLPALMGKAIWIAGESRQGVFVVERYGVLRQAP